MIAVGEKNGELFWNCPTWLKVTDNHSYNYYHFFLHVVYSFHSQLEEYIQENGWADIKDVFLRCGCQGIDASKNKTKSFKSMWYILKSSRGRGLCAYALSHHVYYIPLTVCSQQKDFLFKHLKTIDNIDKSLALLSFLLTYHWRI